MSKLAILNTNNKRIGEPRAWDKFRGLGDEEQKNPAVDGSGSKGKFSPTKAPTRTLTPGTRATAQGTLPGRIPRGIGVHAFSRAPTPWHGTTSAAACREQPSHF